MVITFGSLIVILGILSRFSGIIQERIILSKLEMRKLQRLKVDKSVIEKESEGIKSKFWNKLMS
jgi:hypothetical protein